MKIGDSLYSFRITVDFKNDTASFSYVEEVKIIGINDKLLAINDSNFNRYDLKKDRYSSNRVMKKVYVHHFVMTDYYDELIVSYISPNQSVTIAKKVMKKEAEKFLYEKFGKYCGKEILLNQI